MIIVPLTRDIYYRFGGDYPPFTIKGLAVVDGDLVLGILGVSKIEGQNFIITGTSPELGIRKIIESWRMFKKDFMSPNEKYYTLMDEEIGTSKGFIEHFNFQHITDNIYIYRG